MWKLKSSERLSHWREFRKSLNSLSLDEALDKTAEFWNGCPFTPYYLDPDEPANWPDPWTLVEENYYCDLAKSLGILYTIALTIHKPSCEIRVYYDVEARLHYNLVWIEDGKYILNMKDGGVVNKTHISQHFELRRCYVAEELNLNSY